MSGRSDRQPEEHLRDAKKPPPRRLPGYDEALIQRLCVRVYRSRLEASCRGDADRLLAKNGEEKFAKFALIYAPTVRATLDALNEETT